MKKLTYPLLALFTVVLFACAAPESSQESEDQIEEASDAAAHESHEGHDHAQMEEAAATTEFIKAPEGARVFFVNLKNDQRVTSPVKIEMGVEGMTVHPAGELIEGTGHHHLVLSGMVIPEGSVIPADEVHIHFGGGQTETEIELEPGVYQIGLQFADGLHRSYGDAMFTHINLEVAPK